MNANLKRLFIWILCIVNCILLLPYIFYYTARPRIIDRKYIESIDTHVYLIRGEQLDPWDIRPYQIVFSKGEAVADEGHFLKNLHLYPRVIVMDEYPTGEILFSKSNPYEVFFCDPSINYYQLMHVFKYKVSYIDDDDHSYYVISPYDCLIKRDGSDSVPNNDYICVSCELYSNTGLVIKGE